MQVESDTLSELRAVRDSLEAEIARLGAREGQGAADRVDKLRAHLANVTKKIDQLELAEESGRQQDA